MATRGDLAQADSELRVRLSEAEEALDAIRTGAVDAIVGKQGSIFERIDAEKPYVTFFDAMNEGGVTLDRLGLILHGNPRFSAMVGKPIASLRGSAFVSYLAPPDCARVADFLANDRTAAIEVFLDTAREPMPVRLSLRTIASGQLEFRCIVVTDLSERAKADAELRIAEIAFESQEGMTVTDANRVIVRVNRAFTQLTGYSREEAVGKTPAILRSGRHDPEFYRRMWDTLTATKHWQGEIWNRHKDGRIYAHWLTISAVCTPDGNVTHYVGVLSEITRNKEAEAEIHRLAYYDPLTGLPNRRLLLDRLKQAVAGSARTGRYGAVLFLDLDNFKTLNDTRGHEAGDHLLRAVAMRLRECVREVDTVARLGGDEFLVLLEDLGTDAQTASMQAQRVGEKIRESLGNPCGVEGGACRVSASIGISLFRERDVSVDDLLKHADLALYKAKDAGRNTLRFYDPMMQAALDSRVALESDLREAIDREELLLYYQPQLDDSRRVTGAEALLRWMHPRRGLMAPDEFISLAEQCGLILPLGHCAMKMACAQLKAWAASPVTRHLQIAVNVSLHEFRQAGFVASLQALLQEAGGDPNRLKIELTESMLIDDIEGAMATMHSLKAIGVGIAIDDFGTGYSSLSYLIELPIDELKIDRSFVVNLPHEPRGGVVAQTIVDMARNLELDIVAEGVESEAQFAFLKDRGCRAFQGFLFSRPLPPADFERYLQSFE